MINRKGFICRKIIKNNSGTTMMEVLVSFVVLMIVMAALYGMVRISSNLRMRAVDTANIREEFNSEIYKNHSSDKVDTYYYNGKCAPDRLTMFTLKLSDSTDNSNLRVGTSSVDRTKFENSIRIPCIDAVGYVSNDSRIKEENIVPPKVILFKYHKE